MKEEVFTVSGPTLRNSVLEASWAGDLDVDRHPSHRAKDRVPGFGCETHGQPHIFLLER